MRIGSTEFDGVGLALAAQLFGRQPELVAERPGECFVGAIARLQRDRQDVGRAVGKGARRFAQPPAAQIAHDGTVQHLAEGARHVEPRDAAGCGDVVERNVGVADGLR